MQYRYAMVLHADQKHPHVHLVVKAEHEYEPGQRLYIRKATLRIWREQFASYLRAEGVAANATPKQVRGRAHIDKKGPIHQRLKDIRDYEVLSVEQKALRSPPVGSYFMRSKVQAVADELKAGRLQMEPAKSQLIATRRQVIGDLVQTAATLRSQGEEALALKVEDDMPSLTATA